jgi:hypothetical protein
MLAATDCSGKILAVFDIEQEEYESGTGKIPKDDE